MAGECNRLTLVQAWAGAALLVLLMAPFAHAQEGVSGVAPTELEELVVVGSRAIPRSVEDSSVPVDNIGREDLARQGVSDMTNLIRALVPSFHSSDHPTRDLSALLRPVNLRGLAPDHTLVLMNNKRRHRGSVIQWVSNGASNGAQGPDISAIPAIAVERLEVLRDGAAAQYGSDAIAGVLNFILKDAAEGVAFEARYGAHTEDSDEDMTTVAANFGLPLTGSGFANLSIELAESAPTVRSVQHQDATALSDLGIANVANPAKPWGSAEVSNSIKTVANFGIDLNGGHSLYAFGNYTNREVKTPFFYRSPFNRTGIYITGDNSFLVGGEGCQAKYQTPATADNLLAFRDAVSADAGCFSFVEPYPQGFTPLFGAEITDYSLVAGVRGGLASGLRYDVSGSVGENNMDGYLKNSLNGSLGPGSPRDFEIGEYTQTETNFNVDLSMPVDVGMASALNIAGGFEWREEKFEIDTGEQASWQVGPYVQYGFGSGSNGFGGFNPTASGSWDRANVAVWLDLEVNATDNWRIGGAVRWEDFDGFGSTANFKLATHWRISEAFALRGSLGTGFRAPTPGQSNARNIATEVIAATNAFEERGTIGSTHPVARALGGRELEPEESENLSLGAILTLDNGLSLTVDWFRIDLDDRLALTGLFNVTEELRAELIAGGVPEAREFGRVRFFANDFDTRTQGVDVVLSYGWGWGPGDTELLLTFNHTSTEVRDFRAGSAITGDDTIDNLEHGAPETRFNLALAHNIDQWRLLARYSYFGEWYDDHSAAEFDGYGLVDLAVEYNFQSGWALVLGADNVLDEYPETAINYGNGRKYPRYSPAGHNGALVYAKISFLM